MPMPEATMHKNRCTVPSKYNVGLAWQLTPTEPKPKAPPVKGLA
jgi:hypothetical protein